MADSEPMTSEQRRILSIVLVPVFMSLLAISSVNVILPSVERTLQASTSEIQWVLTGYTLAFGVVLVAGGRAGDVYGRGRLFVAGLALFTLGSAASGLAPNGLWLDIARIVMGFGSGLLNPQAVGFIQQYFDGPRRGRAYGMFGSIVGVSVAIGPVMGGVLIALAGPAWGWRLTFLINVPIAIGAIIVALVWFPASAWRGSADRDRFHADTTIPASRRTRQKPDLDVIGMVLFAVATLLIMLTFLELDRGWRVIALLPPGLAFLGLWLGWERRYRRRGGSPMVDLELFAVRSYANGTALIGLYFTGVTSVWVIVAIYLQNGFGFSALQAALVGVPAAVATAVAARIAGKYVLRTGRAMVAAGIGVALTGLLSSIGVVLAGQVFGLSPWWLLITLTFLGAAGGMVISPNQTLTLAEVPAAGAGSAGGVIQTGQRVGTAIGIALITTAFFAVQANHGWDLAFAAAFGIIAVIVCASGAVALADVRATARARR